MRNDPEAPVVPVLIVGAGPTGVTAALLLARRGVRCLVVERHGEIHPLPRAVHLDDEAVRILQQVGIAEEFHRISRPAVGLRLLDDRMRPFAEFRRDRPVGHHGHPEANFFEQPDLERLLRAKLAERSDISLRTGWEVLAVVRPGSPDAPVRVDLRQISTGCTETVWAHCVLGCDGAGSLVRRAIGVPLRDLGFTERWFVLDVRCRRALPSWGGVDQVCDPRRAATFLALPGDRYRWEFRMHAGESEQELARPERVAELTAPWRVPAGELEVLRAAAYTFQARIAERWRVGRVLLLGDAAHLMPPFIGQGLGAGLRDAHNLAWKLAAVLHAEGSRLPLDEESILDSYQAERGPHTEAVIRTSIRVGRAMTGGQRVAAALRRPLAQLLLRVPGVEGRALREISTRYPAGPLVDRRRHRRDLPGTVCPQPVVWVGGRPIRLDDTLGEGFALLATGRVDEALRARAEAVGARTVQVRDGESGDGSRICDRDGALRGWMRQAGVNAVLLRPDHVVLAARGGWSRAQVPVRRAT